MLREALSLLSTHLGDATNSRGGALSKENGHALGQVLGVVHKPKARQAAIAAPQELYAIQQLHERGCLAHGVAVDEWRSPCSHYPRRSQHQDLSDKFTSSRRFLRLWVTRAVVDVAESLP